MFSQIILADSGSNFFMILLPLALILSLSKLVGIGFKKIGIPQVIGMLIVGILIGCIKYIPNQAILTPGTIEGIEFIAEIGVILIMFSAGIETDLKQIKSTGVAATVITTLGVIVPLVFGFVVSGIFNGFTTANIWSNLFYGVILTATSVSVTVATLKELGKLNTKIGTAIVSAAIIDDVIGVVILSVVLSLSDQAQNGGSASGIWLVIAKTLLFFILVVALGFIVHKIFNWIEKKHPNSRRISIFSLAFCFLLAYLSEAVFGIADITGAYAAGLILAGRKSSEYVERRTDIASYIIFTPVFFAKIGITIDFGSMNTKVLGFGLCFVLAGMLGKFLGCGLGAKMCRFSWKDSIRSGLGMMVRAEVCLICADKGIKAGIISDSIEPFILILILVTSFITPIFLKLSYRSELKAQLASTECTLPSAPEEQSNFVKNAIDVQTSMGTIDDDAPIVEAPQSPDQKQ